MIELKRFQLPVATCQSTAFNFERASVTLLARHQRRGAIALNLQIRSEWRDPAAFRYNSIAQQGVHRNG